MPDRILLSFAEGSSRILRAEAQEIESVGWMVGHCVSVVEIGRAQLPAGLFA